jgi:pyridinium-3,5-biscarboxylic acid mononucleotide sulfurtransferase
MDQATHSTPLEPDPVDAGEKEQRLRTMMRRMERVLVGYSGGVDSTYLAAVATQELKGNALCVTGLSPSVSEHQRRRSAELAAQFSFNHKTVNTSEMERADYRKNGIDRCFFCKDELYSVLESVSEDFGGAVILDGTNADDLSDHRPGRIAAKQHNVRSPLAEAGLTKEEIRALSRRLGLPTWDEPASPCLSSRIAPGVPVTIERLGKVETAEEYLRSIGFREFRVRVHGEIARVEIAPVEMEKIFDLETIERINSRLSQIGFRFVTVDLAGFRSGSMNP